MSYAGSTLLLVDDNTGQRHSEYKETVFNNNAHAVSAEVICSATARAGKAIIYFIEEEEEQYWVLQGVKSRRGKVFVIHHLLSHRRR